MHFSTQSPLVSFLHFLWAKNVSHRDKGIVVIVILNEIHLENLFALINLGPFRLSRHLAASQSDEGGSFCGDGGFTPSSNSR